MHNQPHKSIWHVFPATILLASLVVIPPLPATAKEVQEPPRKQRTTHIVDDSDTVSLTESRPLADQVMGRLRAGFWDPSGLIVRFAVDVRTQIDGALAFVRSIVVTPDADHSFQTVTSAEVSPHGLPNSLSAELNTNRTGALVTGPGGTTELLTQTINGGLASIILNTADNRTITQTMTVNLLLHNVTTAIEQMASAHQLNAPAGLGQIAHMHRVGLGL